VIRRHSRLVDRSILGIERREKAQIVFKTDSRPRIGDHNVARSAMTRPCRLRGVPTPSVRINKPRFEPFFFRFRSIRAKSARVGVPIPEALASFVRNSS